MKDILAQIASIGIPFMLGVSEGMPRMNKTKLLEALIIGFITLGGVALVGKEMIDDVIEEQVKIIAQNKELYAQQQAALLQLGIWGVKVEGLQKTTDELKVRFDRVERDLYTPFGARDHWGFREQGTDRNGKR